MSAPEPPEELNEEEFKELLESSHSLVVRHLEELSKKQFQGLPSNEEIERILQRAGFDRDVIELARSLTSEFKANTLMRAELKWKDLAVAAKREVFKQVEKRHEVHITTEITNPKEHDVLLTLVIEIPKELAITPSEIARVSNGPYNRPHHPHISILAFDPEPVIEEYRPYTVLKDDLVIQVPVEISAKMAEAVHIQLPNYPDENALMGYKGPVIIACEQIEIIRDLYY